MPGKLLIPANTRRLLGLCVLLTLGAGSGALVGAASAAQPIAGTRQAVRSQSAAAIDDPYVIGTLTVEEPPAPTRSAPVGAKAGPSINRPARTSTKSGASYTTPLVASVPGATAVAAPAAAIQCDRLDDAKIHWLLNLVAKTRAANPDMDQAGARVDRELRGALGKNMCAAEAQRYVGAMCAEPAVYAFMQKMVEELPFFVRPIVGDPCTHDLVAVANKYMR